MSIFRYFIGKIKIIVFISISQLFFSCSDFLKGEPEIAFTTETFYTDTLKLSMAALGVYEPLLAQDTYGNALILVDAGDDLMLSGDLTADASGTMPSQVGCYNVNSNSKYVLYAWNLFYKGVNYANSVIANSKNLVYSEDENVRKISRKYVAEAKVLRAYYYLELVTRWGDVPFRTEPTTLDNSYSTRTSKAEIYDFIINDVEECLMDLPWHDEDSSMKGRINRGTALGILSKICMFAGGYSLYQDGIIRRPDNYIDYYKKAELYTRELISSGKHDLNADYEAVFKNLCQNVIDPKESLFELDFAYVNGDDSHACRLGVNIGVGISGNTDIYNNNPRIYTSYFAYKKFEDGDLRREISVADYTLTGEDFVETPISVTSSNKWGIGKWRRDWHIPVPSHRNFSDANYPLLRYSEVLLMRAETLNELNNGPTEEAIELVNMVRRRGYGLDINTPSKVSDVPVRYRVGKNEFFGFITDEYAREFLGEPGRKFHLIRWNLLKEKIDEIGDFFDNPDNYKKYHSLSCLDYGGFLTRRLFTTGKHELWPIPFDEITESNGNITENNPGY